MKLKKLLTPVCWAIIVAMGITLTGCVSNGRDVLDEISSVMNEESSRDTNTESSGDKNSTDANTESSNGGNMGTNRNEVFCL